MLKFLFWWVVGKGMEFVNIYRGHVTCSEWCQIYVSFKLVYKGLMFLLEKPFSEAEALFSTG
jgi:hypothetical protein